MSNIYFIDEKENTALTQEIIAEQSHLFTMLENPSNAGHKQVELGRKDSGVYRAIRKVTSTFSSSILPIVKAH